MAVNERIQSKTTTNAEEQRTIPVWESTRDRAREMKGEQSYDELISTLLDRYESDVSGPS